MIGSRIVWRIDGEVCTIYFEFAHTGRPVERRLALMNVIWRFPLILRLASHKHNQMTIHLAPTTIGQLRTTMRLLIERLRDIGLLGDGPVPDFRPGHVYGLL